MRKLISVLTILTFCGTLSAADFVAKRVKGSVEVRQGVSEEWSEVKVGDILSPDNTIMTGKKSSLTIVQGDGEQVIIPELTILDVGDLRTMSQEELLLKLAMADVRAIPAQESGREIAAPNTTVIHGRNPSASEDRAVETQKAFREMEVKGTKVLYNYGFYSTCILRAKEMLRFYPELKSRFEFRTMIANALERNNLRGEALNEYFTLSAEKLPYWQKRKVEGNIRRLKKQ